MARCGAQNVISMKCPICRINEAQVGGYWGVLPCNQCQERQSKLQKPNKQIEFTTQSIKDQRKAYGQDTWGIHRKGELSKEWVERYGIRKARDRGFTNKEIKKAKNVWKGTETYYK